MNDKEALAESIRRLWKDKTASSLAQKAGIKKSTLSEYMNSKRFPRKKNFEAIARGLGCTPEELEECIWELRLEARTTPRHGTEVSAFDTVSGKFHEVLFKGREIDRRTAEDPKLKSILEEVSAAIHHIEAAKERYAAAWVKLVDFLDRDPSSQTGA